MGICPKPKMKFLGESEGGDMTPRPRRFRYCRPYVGDGFFKPKGIPLADLEVAELAHDELEALRLCDFEEQEQEQAAKSMSISRQTLQRLLYAGRKKVADALKLSKLSAEDILCNNRFRTAAVVVDR